MSKTKIRILENALYLFNNEGVENISTRHIAQKMQISVGNLHYHYPNKNELILNIQKEFLNKSDELAHKLMSTSPGADALNSSISEVFNLIYDYRFLFNERLLLSRKIPTIQKMFMEMLATRKKEFLDQTICLKSEGLIRKDIPNEQYDFLFYQIVILYNSWTSHIPLLVEEEHKKDVVNKFVKIVSSIWTPYFTPKGLSLFVK